MRIDLNKKKPFITFMWLEVELERGYGPISNSTLVASQSLLGHTMRSGSVLFLVLVFNGVLKRILYQPTPISTHDINIGHEGKSQQVV